MATTGDKNRKYESKPYSNQSGLECCFECGNYVSETEMKSVRQPFMMKSVKLCKKCYDKKFGKSEK